MSRIKRLKARREAERELDRQAREDAIAHAAATPAPRPAVDFRALIADAAAAAVRGVEDGRRDAEEARRRGGPCGYCGTRFSDAWSSGMHGTSCAECAEDGYWYATDTDRRLAILCRLFTPAERHGWVGHALVERAELPWFREVLTGTDGTPWSYVTPDMREAVTRRLKPGEAVIPGHDEHCPRCGCSTEWQYGPRPADPPTSRPVSQENRQMARDRGLPEPEGYEVPGTRPDGIDWWCRACRTGTVHQAAAALTPELSRDILSARPDQSVMNRAGIVDFRHTDGATRARHDPTRPYSWLDTGRIRASMPRAIAATLRTRMAGARG